MSSTNFKNRVEELKNLFDNDIQQVNDTITLDSLKIKYLGRKGEISKFFSKMGKLQAEEKKETGKLINDLKNHINATLTDHRTHITEKTEKETFFDYTLPSDKPFTGRYHPLTIVTRKIKDCFKKMGFSSAKVCILIKQRVNIILIVLIVFMIFPSPESSIFSRYYCAVAPSFSRYAILGKPTYQGVSLSFRVSIRASMLIAARVRV